jgi:hypothetical protein
MHDLPKNLKAAILHGEYMKACADMEQIGTPLDVPTLRHLQKHWDNIRRKLVGQSISKYPIFDGTHFSHELFEKFLVSKGLDKSWPRTTKSGVRRTDADTWHKQAALHSEIEGARVLFHTMNMDKLNLACDVDGRNRVLLGAFGTVTGRNAPSGAKENGTFIFAPAKWARFLIKPPKGMALAYLDWASQEYGILGVLSGDGNMLRAYESGDPYMEFAILAGAAPRGATKASHRQVRNLYKIVALAVGYGMRWWGLKHTAGISERLAKKVYDDYTRVFSVYCEWREKQIDEFALRGQITTVLGWPLHRSDATRVNTVINFGGQANAAEMLRIAIIETRRRGVEICAPVHDALLIQAPVREIRKAISEAREAMAAASKIILRGYELRVDCKDDAIVEGKVVRGDITRYPQRFYSEDGADFWYRIQRVSGC